MANVVNMQNVLLKCATCSKLASYAIFCDKCHGGKCSCTVEDCCSSDCRCSVCKDNRASFSGKGAFCPEGFCKVGQECECGDSCKCSDGCQCPKCFNFVCSNEFMSGKFCGTSDCRCNGKCSCPKCKSKCTSAMYCPKCTGGKCGCTGASCCTNSCRCPGCKVNRGCFSAKGVSCPDGKCQVGLACKCGDSCTCSDGCTCIVCKDGCKSGLAKVACSMNCQSGKCFGTSACRHRCNSAAVVCVKCHGVRCGCTGAGCCTNNFRCPGCKVNCGCFVRRASCLHGVCRIGRECRFGCKCCDACKCHCCKGGCKCGGANFVGCVSGQCCGMSACHCNSKCACPRCGCNC
ncbi:keratin-associated protein 5-1-like [Pecten maximus]|uniref:keratin-associated protein 5-1-like n=1 Tax=Pecten maximus TaxID=6579 RepID=UPI001458F976|nr:keratin-associated protein 5-1-like [Pecten maximus]